jgi:hypothetical protein
VKTQSEASIEGPRLHGYRPSSPDLPDDTTHPLTITCRLPTMARRPPGSHACSACRPLVARSSHGPSQAETRRERRLRPEHLPVQKSSVRHRGTARVSIDSAFYENELLRMSVSVLRTRELGALPYVANWVRRTSARYFAKVCVISPKNFS